MKLRFFDKFVQYYKTHVEGVPIRTVCFQWYNNMKQELCSMYEKLHDLRATNFNLGIYHFNHGKIHDAIFRFKILQFFTPKQHAIETIDYYLGRCYLEQFKYDKALLHLGRYLSSPDQQFTAEAKYCSDIISRNDNVLEIPLSIIRHIFNRTAIKHGTIHIHNSAQKSLYNALYQQAQLSTNPFSNNILDIGCGTGIIGQLCREARIANVLAGIDISPSMLNIADSLIAGVEKVYSQLIQGDAVAVLNEMKERGVSSIYNIAIMADFITYCPKLNELFSAIYPILNNSGILAVSFRNSNYKDFHFVSKLEQFRFNIEYVKTLAITNKWQPIYEQQIEFFGNEAGTILLFSKHI